MSNAQILLPSDAGCPILSSVGIREQRRTHTTRPRTTRRDRTPPRSLGWLPAGPRGRQVSRQRRGASARGGETRRPSSRALLPIFCVGKAALCARASCDSETAGAGRPARPLWMDKDKCCWRVLLLFALTTETVLERAGPPAHHSLAFNPGWCREAPRAAFFFLQSSWHLPSSRDPAHSPNALASKIEK